MHCFLTGYDQVQPGEPQQKLTSPSHAHACSLPSPPPPHNHKQGHHSAAYYSTRVEASPPHSTPLYPHTRQLTPTLNLLPPFPHILILPPPPLPHTTTSRATILQPYYSTRVEAGLFHTTVYLPSNCGIGAKVEGCPPAAGSRASKQQAALHALRRLFQAGKLNDHLQPVWITQRHSKQLGEWRNARRLVHYGIVHFGRGGEGLKGRGGQCASHGAAKAACYTRLTTCYLVCTYGESSVHTAFASLQDAC